jgi:hypothetical protein
LDLPWGGPDKNKNNNKKKFNSKIPEIGEIDSKGFDIIFCTECSHVGDQNI